MNRLLTKDQQTDKQASLDHFPEGVAFGSTLILSTLRTQRLAADLQGAGAGSICPYPQSLKSETYQPTVLDDP